MIQPQIDLSGWYAVVAIWQFSNKKWTLIELTRLREAIVVCRHYRHPESSWLVFPTKFNPMVCQRYIQPTSKQNQSDRSQIHKLQKLLSIS